jgi:hypothetical protein
VRVADGLGGYQEVSFTLILEDVNRPPDWPGRLPPTFSVRYTSNSKP